MIHGVDTSFLITVEIEEHPFHLPASQFLKSVLQAGHSVALLPQVLAEFLHVVTDSKRFQRPFSMDEALAAARQWWEAQETIQMYPTRAGVVSFQIWMRDYRLGRKRILDTLLASSYRQHGVSAL